MAQPARRRRIPENSKSNPPSGLLSNVFSFVSREFESFLHNATAGRVNQPTSSGRVRSSGRRRNDAELERNMSDDEARHRSRAHRHREARGRSKPDSSHLNPRSKSSDPTRKHRHRHVEPTYIDVDEVLSASDRERSESPTRPQSASQPAPTRKLKKQPSITMPGSLFPRSSSIGPDASDREQSTQLVSHVCPSTNDSDADDTEAGPSRASASTKPTTESVNPTQSPLDQYVSPWRTRSVASVTDAVQRFNATEGAEADFSLMLPSPQASPVKPASKARYEDDGSPQTTRSNLPPPASMSRKGKERAREDRIHEDLDFIVGPSAGHVGVFAKERELDAAREEQREHERRSSGDPSRRASGERERDKQRIKALEEEVRWLKEQLSRSQLRSSPPLSSGPPPPPPPPPPPLPLRIDATPSTPTSMFATARASLRHAMTPVEAPINNPGLGRTKRQGQPTVNVPSDKMAAFLNEIKTARLRKVGGGTGSESAAGPSGFSKSVAGTSSTASARPGKLSAKELLRRRSLANLRVPIDSVLAAPVPPSILAASLPASAFKEPELRVGQKRKADAIETEDSTGRMPKRRMTESSSQSSSGASQSSAASSSILHLSDLSHPSHTLPATNETDITTPSLCSDNEREGENSIEDRVPSTPPGPRPPSSNPNDSRIAPHEDHIEVIDVDMEAPSSVPRRTSDLFKKRPPTSPIPNPTPRRPSAPARTKRGVTPRPKAVPPLESEGEDEDGARSRGTPVPISLIPAPKSKSKAKPSLVGKGYPRAKQQNTSQSTTPSAPAPGSQSKRKKTHKRRPTLDEEIRTAEARSSDIDQGNDELNSDAEDDVFIGKGTKSSRNGFLAHGGGGGAPVFMGVGYVQGAALESEDEDRVMETRARRIHKSSSQVSLIPRPKART